MTDAEALSGVLGNPVAEKRLTLELKEIWRVREAQFVETHSRTAWCDCLMFQPGDYALAAERVK